MNVHIQRVAQIKVRHIESYIHERLAQGIGKRTLQNEMASLRAVLQQAGRKQVAEHEWLTNKSLGLAGASRSGTRQAITPEHYHHVLETARMKDPGLAAAAGTGEADGLTFTGSGAECAMDLGHRDGRGRYVAQVYGQI
ncbi:Putative DNA-binding protein [Salmonella enterica subsp. enterica]|nr:Putative DNA-binding protein [Salmonella enterica subsp. enterica]